MNRKLLIIATLTFFTININTQVFAWGGYGYGGWGYPGFYGGFGYPGFYGGWYGPGLYGGLYFANLAAYNNRNNVDPVAQARADQIRYDTQKQREEDRDRKKKNKLNQYKYDQDTYDRNDDLLHEIKQLKQQVADLESLSKIRN